MADVNKIIKDLAGDFSGSNEEQMKGIQLLKGLATSDDPKANRFMKAVDKATTKISREMGEIKKEESVQETFVESTKKAKEYFLKESKQIDPFVLDSIITEVEEFTNNNAHGEAYQFIASSLGYRDYEKKFNDINKQHRALGHLPPKLNELRYNYYKDMFRDIKRDYGQEVYKALYSAT